MKGAQDQHAMFSQVFAGVSVISDEPSRVSRVEPACQVVRSSSHTASYLHELRDRTLSNEASKHCDYGELLEIVDSADVPHYQRRL